MGPYGQLLHNAATVWAANTKWRPGKWASYGIMLAAAQDPAYEAAVAAKAKSGTIASSGPVSLGSTATTVDLAPAPPPTLVQLVQMAFELVLVMYAAQLPFGGYWVRVAETFVVDWLSGIPIPPGLEHS